MEKRAIIIIFTIILIFIMIAGVLKLTGFYVTPSGHVKGCNDTDRGVNIYEKGTISYSNRDYIYTDYCVRTSKVKEYFCDPPIDTGIIHSKKIGCPNGCKDGACINKST